MIKTIKKNIKRHWHYYLILSLVQIFGFWLVWITAFSFTLQMAIVVGITVIFTMLELLHHVRQHDLHPKIVLEYVLMGGFGIALAFFMLQGGLQYFNK